MAVKDATKPEPIVLTVPEFAAVIKESRRRVYQLIAAGEVRSYKSGRSRRIASVEAQRYVENRQAEAAI